MANFLNLSLTDELRAFVDANCGDGTLYATPSEFVRDIQGALAKVGYRISDTTVGNVLKQHGIEPAPDRGRSTSWSTFLKPHWDVLAAIDFTTAEVWTKGGLVTFYLLFVVELKTRRIHFAG